MFTVARHLPRPAIRVIERQIQRLEAEAKQTLGAGKAGRNHVFKLEVRFERGLVQVMLGLAAFFGVIVPVPRAQAVVDTVVLHHPRQDRGVLFRLGAGRRPDLHQQIPHPIRRACHFGFQLVGGKTVIAQQMRTLFPQRQNLRCNRAIVRLSAICAARRPCGKGGFAQIAPWGKLQKRRNHRTRGGDHRRIEPLFLARFARCIDHKLRQPLQIIFAQRHVPLALICQKVLHELGPQRSEARFDLFHAIGGIPFQSGPRPDKPAPGQHQKALLLVIQVQRVTTLPQIGDACEQRGIGGDLSIMRRDPGREFALQSLARWVAVGACHGEEHRQHLIQRPASAFQRLDRIDKTWLLRRSRNRLDLGAMQRQRLIKGRGKIIVRDGVKRGNAERGRPRGQKRVHMSLHSPSS